MRVLRWTLGLLVVVAAALGCTIDLEPRISCGDGYMDELAGEECDPRAPETFEHACARTQLAWGDAQCDPVQCVILDEPEHCCACGDGIVSPECGEECDGDVNGKVCPGGGDGLQCIDCKLDLSECPTCECQPGSGDGFADPVECEDLDPYIVSRDYTSGATTWCGADCYFDRAGCGYCDDGRLDIDPVPVWFGIETRPEWCDGDEIDESRLPAGLVALCSAIDPALRPNVACGEDCESFIEDPQEPCCLREFAACPAPGEPLRCCYEHAHSGEDPCTTYVGDFWDEVCK